MRRWRRGVKPEDLRELRRGMRAIAEDGGDPLGEVLYELATGIGTLEQRILLVGEAVDYEREERGALSRRVGALEGLPGRVKDLGRELRSVLMRLAELEKGQGAPEEREV